MINDVRTWHDVFVAYLFVLLQYLLLENGKAARNLNISGRRQGFMSDISRETDFDA